MSYPVLFSAVIVCVGIAIVRTQMLASRLSRLGWDDLLARLEPVPMEGVAAVALDYLHPGKGQLRIETSELWVMIGGDEGVRRMHANATILIALAGYAQRWNPVESSIVTERMRRDGVTMRRAALQLSLGFFDRRGNVRGPFNVQEVASAYYLMRQRLLALYETSHAGRYPQLAASL